VRPYLGNTKRKASCFNPHPARRPGATAGQHRVFARPHVSTLTRPEDRVRRIAYLAAQGYVELVSTLTRPEDRVRPVILPRAAGFPLAFQPSPGPKTGCDHHRDRGRAVPAQVVSTLTRPEDRVRLHGFVPSCVPPPFRAPNPAGARFNPHPARRPGATILAYPPPRRAAFQPSPGPKTGCDSVAPPTGASCCSFNPHPARRPGATREHARNPQQRGDVSTLTRPEDRVRRVWVAKASLKMTTFQPSPGPKTGCDEAPRPPRRRCRVSTLTRPEDRVRPSALPGAFGVERNVSTLTRPEDRVRPQPPPKPPREKTFQPSPGPKTGCDVQPEVQCAMQRVSTLTRPEDRVRQNRSSSPKRDTRLVSTLTRPEDRVRRAVKGNTLATGIVSTLTRPEDRVRRSVHEENRPLRWLPGGRVAKCRGNSPRGAGANISRETKSLGVRARILPLDQRGKRDARNQFARKSGTG